MCDLTDPSAKACPNPSTGDLPMPPAPAPPSASVLLPLHLRPAPTRKSGDRHVYNPSTSPPSE
ncbi:hypothetical protein JMJ77_0009131, partial [Colletotrichum scovillei]